MKSSVKFSITIPTYLRQWLDAQSKANFRSLSAEVGYILKDAWKKQNAKDLGELTKTVSEKT